MSEMVLTDSELFAGGPPIRLERLPTEPVKARTADKKRTMAEQPQKKPNILIIWGDDIS